MYFSFVVFFSVNKFIYLAFFSAPTQANSTVLDRNTTALLISLDTVTAHTDIVYQVLYDENGNTAYTNDSEVNIFS